jgi:hypothetical protein
VTLFLNFFLKYIYLYVLTPQPPPTPATPKTVWCGTWDSDAALVEVAPHLGSVVRRMDVPPCGRVADLTSSRTDGRVHGVTDTGRTFAIDPREPVCSDRPVIDKIGTGACFFFFFF